MNQFNTALHKVAAPAVREAVKTELSYRERKKKDNAKVGFVSFNASFENSGFNMTRNNTFCPN